MFAVLAFVPAAILLDLVSNPVVVATVLGAPFAPRTQSEEVEPWDI